MKNKKTRILIIIFLIGIIMSLLLVACDYQVRAAQFNPDPYVKDIHSDSTTGTDNLKSIGSTIIGLLRGVGTIASVAVLIVIGIKYMMGSAEERAEYKKTMLPYVIGAIMVFSITNLLSIVISVAGAIK